MFTSKRNSITKQSGDSQIQAVMPKKKMGQFEKWFWITIVVLFIVWLSLQMVASSREGNASERLAAAEAISETVTEKIFNGFGVNMDKYSQEIDKDSLSKLSGLDQLIDTEVERLFAPIYGNVDRFLDFHYSVVGEYTELGAALEGKLSQTISDKIFGQEFGDRLSETDKNIKNGLAQVIKDHLGTINNIATRGIDTDPNADTLKSVANQINSDIEQRFDFQNIKLDAVMGIGAIAMTAKLATAIASKIAGKAVIKGAAKVGTKGAAATGAAAAGLACGPLAVVCAPALAIGAWFATDAIVASVDEKLHRDELRAEMMRSIDEQKQKITEGFKLASQAKFQDVSKVAQESYKAPVKVKDQILK